MTWSRTSGECARQCCCGSVRIRIILSDPDREGIHPGHADLNRYQCHAYEKVGKLYFSKKILISKVFRIMTSLTPMRNIKHCELAKL